MSSFLVQGRIIWATLPDPRGGNEKARPAVIVTSTNNVLPGGQVEVAAITTLIGHAPFSETVELPFSTTGHPDTKLKKPCEAVCSWVVSLPVASIRDSGGFVPADVLVELLAKIQRLS
jgi:mRNA-degrading endonuclease toxin of MazEF toxin-antitoxin module